MMFLQEVVKEVANISNANTGWIIAISTIGGSLLSGILTYLFARKQNVASINNTEAETTKIKADTISLTIDKLIELTTKFKLAQDEYILLKDRFATLTREMEDFKDRVRDLIELLDVSLQEGDSAHSQIHNQVAKIKAEFLTMVEK